MKKFAVAYVSLFTGEMQLEFIEAFTEVEAALTFLNTTYPGADIKLPTLEEVYSYVFELDAYIEVKELPN